MLKSVNLLDTMSAMAGHAAKRHAVIAENIANADTPGFQAQDIQPFAEIFEIAARDKKNIKTLQADVVLMDVNAAASPNGNTVSLEQQMMHSVQAKGDHDMALAVYRKSLDMMKMALGKNI